MKWVIGAQPAKNSLSKEWVEFVTHWCFCQHCGKPVQVWPPKPSDDEATGAG